MTGCIKEKQTGADLKVGDVLPDFEVMMNDGSVVTDEILKEKVSVVIRFYLKCRRYMMNMLQKGLYLSL